MDLYIVLKNKYSQNYEIERMTDIQWNTVKNNINKDRVIYVTCDIKDKVLDTYNFKEIIWERIFDDNCKNYRKVKIPFSCNIQDIEEALKKERTYTLNKIIKEREQYINKKHIEIKKDKPRITISKNLSNKEAMIEWYSLGCPFPAPSRIVNMKRDVGLSWRKLREYILTELISG